MRGCLLLLLLAASALAEEKRPVPGAPGSVSLPLAEYERLVERSRRPRAASEPPVAIAVSLCEVRASVGDDAVRGTLTLEGEAYLPGPLPVALPQLTLLDARNHGRPVPIGPDGALVPGPGAFALQLDWALPLSSEPGRAGFTLALPRAESIRALIDLPGEPADVRVEPGVLLRRTPAQGRTRIEALLPAVAEVRFSWAARELATAPTREARLLADVKTVVSLGEAELQMVAAIDVNVIQGQAGKLRLALPAGYELTGVTGSTLESTAESSGALEVTLAGNARQHQIVLSLSRAGADVRELTLVSVRGAQRETGELGIVGLGTVELVAHEAGTLRRIDAAEASSRLRALAREPLALAFRYHRRESEGPSLTLEAQRFPPLPVLPALAERGVATTLVTAEGRALGEVKLTVRNQAQPFLKVDLPPGATLVSAEVAGQGVKPVSGQDGTRVPLLRPGFRPSGPYEVSFVYSQPGQPLGKRGQLQLALPKLDLPVTVVDWELFLPQRFEVRDFTGNAVQVDDEGIDRGVEGGVAGGVPGGVVGGTLGLSNTLTSVVGIIGRARDQQGSAVPGASVALTLATGATQTATTDSDGWYAFPGAPPGHHRLRCELPGFSTQQRAVHYTGGRFVANFTLAVGGIAETIEVRAESNRSDDLDNRRQQEAQVQQNMPSSNVYALQRRVSGVLPVKVEVPRSGESHRFRRVLALEGETQLGFRYKARR